MIVEYDGNFGRLKELSLAEKLHIIDPQGMSAICLYDLTITDENLDKDVTYHNVDLDYMRILTEQQEHEYHRCPQFFGCSPLGHGSNGNQWFHCPHCKKALFPIRSNTVVRNMTFRCKACKHDIEVNI